MQNAGGRPRGKNYEKNLAKRKKGGNLTSKNESSVRADVINEKLLHLSKSFFGMVNTEGVAGSYGRERKNPTYNYNQVQNINDGVLLRPVWRIPYDTLRNAAYGTSLISAIHTIRVEDLHRFGRINKKEGFWFRTEDEDDKISDTQSDRMKACGKWFDKMGDLCDGWQSRDNLYNVFEMMIRDTLTLDGLAFWTIRNALGKLIELRYLDPATIYPVDPRKGFRGDTSIAYVQMVDSNVVETFSKDEILWNHKNHLSDISMRGFGFSPLEACMLDLTGVINSIKYNRTRFTRQPPPGFLSILADLAPETLEALEIQWQEMISGMDDYQKIPIFGTSAGEVKWTPLNLPNDMIFKDFMQWLVSFVLMAHGMDQAELGLRLIGSQSLSEANQLDKSKHSMTRANKSTLSYLENTFNTIREMREDFTEIRCFFPGQDPEDEKAKLDKFKDEVTNWKLIDEIRIMNDDPTLGETMAELYGVDQEQYKLAGAVILNPVFQQNFATINGGGQENPTGYNGNGTENGFDFSDWDSPSDKEEEPELDEDLVF